MTQTATCQFARI